MKETLSSKAVTATRSIDTFYSSKTLFRGQQEIIIEHEGFKYQLRITRQNKLILTK